MRKLVFLGFFLMFGFIETQAQTEESKVKSLLLQRLKDINTLGEHASINKILDGFASNFTTILNSYGGSMVFNSTNAKPAYKEFIKLLLGESLQGNSLQINDYKIHKIQVTGTSAFASYEFTYSDNYRESQCQTTEVFMKISGKWKSVHIHNYDNFNPYNQEEAPEEAPEEEEY